MANSVDPDQTAENDSVNLDQTAGIVDTDQTAECGKQCRPW